MSLEEYENDPIVIRHLAARRREWRITLIIATVLALVGGLASYAVLAFWVNNTEVREYAWLGGWVVFAYIWSSIISIESRRDFWS